MLKLKNIAIVAHVDHGKTTLIDGLLKQSSSVDQRKELEERVMDSNELEKERGITISAKNCAIRWKDTKINLLDTPGHADFGGEVERSLMMVDGILLLVDASEGPLPQTRFVLGKALERKLRIGVVVNKIDRPDERIDEVIEEIETLFLDLATFLGLEDYDLDIPFYYASGKDGYAKAKRDEPSENLFPLLDFMVSDFFPAPTVGEGEGLQLLVTNLKYSSYLGQQIVGRIHRGEIKKGLMYTHCDRDRKDKNFRVSNVQIFDSLGTAEVSSASAGEIAIISGLEGAQIGDSLVSQENVEPLERVEVDPPTVSVTVSVNTSPGSGREGEYLTSRKLSDYLENACRNNVALQFEPTEDAKVFELKGRGELQLVIVFEEIRRQGFELMVARPRVVFKEIDDQRHEPFERVVLDIPTDSVGTITELLSSRKGIMSGLLPLNEERTRLEFECPSRSLIGYRSQFLTDTRGEGTMSSEFLGYRPYAGDLLSRQNGAIISDRAGKTTPYALFNLLSNGKQFVRPGEQVYEGMVVGEHTRKNDTVVNAVREKHVSAVRTAGKDENIILPPVPERTLDWALSWIDDDEWVEITPINVRIRKKILESNKRTVIR